MPATAQQRVGYTLVMSIPAQSTDELQQHFTTWIAPGRQKSQNVNKVWTSVKIDHDKRGMKARASKSNLQLLNSFFEKPALEAHRSILDVQLFNLRLFILPKLKEKLQNWTFAASLSLFNSYQRQQNKDFFGIPTRIWRLVINSSPNNKLPWIFGLEDNIL